MYRTGLSVTRELPCREALVGVRKGDACWGLLLPAGACWCLIPGPAPAGALHHSNRRYPSSLSTLFHSLFLTLS
eukprot:superscaffoldBa00002353_g14008